MIKLLSTFLFSMFCIESLLSQYNIYSIVHNDKEIKHGYAKHIEWNLVYYGERDTSFLNRSMTLNKDNQVIYEVSTDNQVIRIRSVEFDSITGLRKSSTIETKHPLARNIKEKRIYKYDKNNFLIEVISFDDKDQIKESAKIQNNDQGYPVELISFDKYDQQIGGVEKAEYLFDINRYISTVYSKNGQLLAKDTVILNFPENYKFKDPKTEYNSNGDLFKTDITPNGYILYDFKYDHIGNWTKYTVSRVTISSGGKQEKKLTHIYTRKIKYWKNKTKR